MRKNNYANRSPDGSSIDVQKTQTVGTTINTIVASLQDDALDYDRATYVQNSGPDLSYYFSTADLFYLNTCML